MSGVDQLYVAKGCGSVIVEMACALASMPVETIEVAWTDEGITDPALAAINPLRQVPTYVRHTGEVEVLTESAAIILFLGDLYRQSELTPWIESQDRAWFLRWLMFLNASIYPTFTYADFAEKFAGEAAAAQLRETTLARRMDGYRQLEANVRGPFFMGKTMSAIDLYICAMSYWTPRRAWFEAEVPRLFEIAQRVETNIFVRHIIQRNFGPD
jgi:GST-like protein